MRKVILDTDIGTDVDDVLALSLLLASPQLELLGVTTAYGDTTLRARLAQQLLAYAGRGDIPVIPGRPEPLTPNREIFWPGHEGQHLTAEYQSAPVRAQHAEDFMIETVARWPGEVSIVGIAPLGNLARAILKAPDVMSRVHKVYLMGGVFNLAQIKMAVSEHNIASDPDAAQVVFNSGLPIVLVPLDVTLQTHIDARDLARFGDANAPLTQYLTAEMHTWLRYVRDHFHQDFSYLHDPLTVALLADEQLLLQSEQMRVQVERQGEFTTGMTVPDRRAPQPNVQVVLGVDVDAFQTLFFDRLSRLNTPNDIKK